MTQGTAKTIEAIGLDIGGLRIKAAHVRFEEDGCVIVDHRVVARGPAERSEEGMTARLAVIVNELDETGTLPVGIGVAGIVRSGGVVVRSPNYPDWCDFELGERLRAKTGREVAVDNDANAFLLGELKAGAVVGGESVLALTLGTGLGGAIAHSGRLMRGVRGMAGEIGHVRFVQDGVLCGCGAKGCAEQYMSTQYLKREAEERGHQAVEDIEMVEVGRVLASMARQGDVICQEIFQKMGQNLGTHLGGIANILDPKVILIGGGLASCYDLFEEALFDSLRVYAYDHIAADLELRPSSLMDKAGCVGAAALTFWEQNKGQLV